MIAIEHETLGVLYYFKGNIIPQQSQGYFKKIITQGEKIMIGIIGYGINAKITIGTEVFHSTFIDKGWEISDELWVFNATKDGNKMTFYGNDNNIDTSFINNLRINFTVPNRSYCNDYPMPIMYYTDTTSSKSSNESIIDLTQFIFPLPSMLPYITIKNTITNGILSIRGIPMQINIPYAFDSISYELNYKPDLNNYSKVIVKYSIMSGINTLTMSSECGFEIVVCYPTCASCIDNTTALTNDNNHNCGSCAANHSKLSSLQSNCLNINKKHDYYYYDITNNLFMDCPKGCKHCSYNPTIAMATCDETIEVICYETCAVCTIIGNDYDHQCNLCKEGLIRSIEHKRCITQLRYNEELEYYLTHLNDYITLLERYLPMGSYNGTSFLVFNCSDIAINEAISMAMARHFTLINIDNCKKPLMEKYELITDEDMLIFLSESIDDNTNNEVIFLAMYTRNGIEIDISLCNSSFIIQIPIEDSEDFRNVTKFHHLGINPYDSSSPFFNDICYNYTTKDGLDVPRKNRIEDFFRDNSTLCNGKDNCIFEGIDFESNMTICSCNNNNTKQQSTLNSLQKQNYEEIKKGLVAALPRHNWSVFLCYQKVFDKKIFLMSIGLWCMIGVGGVIIVNIVLFYLKHRLIEIKNYLIEECGKIARDKEKSNDSQNQNQSNVELNQGNNDNHEQSKTQVKDKDMSIDKEKKSIEKGKDVIEKDKDNIEKDNSMSNIIIYSSILKKKSSQKMPIDSIKSIKTLKPSNSIKHTSSFSLSVTSPFKFLLIDDGRNFNQQYLTTLKFVHPISRTFCPNHTHMINSVEMCHFFMKIILDFFFNAFFYDEQYISRNYHNFGQTDFFYNLPISLYSNLVSGFIFLLFRLLVNIEYYITQTVKNNSNDTEVLVKAFLNCLRIRITVYFILECLVMLLGLYYTAAFGGVYQNTQINWFTNGLLSSAITLTLPFIWAMLYNIIYVFFWKKKWGKLLEMMDLLV